MRRRKNKDKRVLKSPRDNGSKHNLLRRSKTNGQKKNWFSSNNQRSRRSFGQNRKQSKTSKTTIFLIIFALIAFVIGAGIGISLAIDGPSNNNVTDDNGVTYVNVTEQMTSNLNSTPTDYYDGVEHVDYNSPEIKAKYNLTNSSVSY